jgi:large subunit ribosomal protein L30
MARTFVWHRTRGPKRTPKSELTSGKVRIEQVRSGIGHSWRMRRTLEALGLRHHQDVVVQQDSPSLRGQLKHVRHLVKVTPVEGGTRRSTGAAGTAAAPRPRARKTRPATERKNDGD